MWQWDFFSKKVVSKTGLRDLFAIAFLHIESRRVFITPATYTPDEAWVLEQAEAFRQFIKEEKLLCKCRFRPGIAQGLRFGRLAGC
jgi:putative transposase